MIPLHPPSIRNFDYRGHHRYFLTWCCDHRKPLFAKADSVDLVRTQFLRASGQTSLTLFAYCFMPDHVHLLVVGETEEADAKAFMKLAKQYSGYYYSKSLRSVLWQRYGYEHVLRSDESTRQVCRYILENPVRARLVTDVREYPYSGSAVWDLTLLIEWAYGPERAAGGRRVRPQSA